MILILNLFELAAAATGFACYRRLRGTYWAAFPWYLLLIVLTEGVAEYFAYGAVNLAINNAIYQYWGIPLQFLFFYWLYFNYFKLQKKSVWPLVATAVYLLATLTDIVLLPKLRPWFFISSYTVGSIFLSLLLLLFFYKLMRSEDIVTFSQQRMFWISLGLLVFYLLTIPFFGLRNVLYFKYPSVFYYYWYISFVLGYIMYSCFIISFIWTRSN